MPLGAGELNAIVLAEELDFDAPPKKLKEPGALCGALCIGVDYNNVVSACGSCSDDGKATAYSTTP